MVGGGPGGFIGDVHRRAMWLDGLYKVTAGVFSRDAAKSEAFGATLGIPAARLYGTYEEMAEKEAALPADERVEVVVVVTPTPAHAGAVAAFASRGFAVICDKPLCSDLGEADSVLALLREKRTPFMLTHNYSGYPMARQAKAMVAAGRIGEVKKVIAEYEQGWLCEEAQLSSTGAITSLADVGTHAFQLLEYVAGTSVSQVFADCETMVGGARTPDDASVLLRLEGGARGVLIASQASAGARNGLRLRVFGTKGGLFWEQESPERLRFCPCGEPEQVLVRGGPGLCDEAVAMSRIPVGHPEGFLEAFANLYANFHRHVASPSEEGAGSPDFPSAADGRAGLAFVAACLASSEAGQWVTLSRE